MSFVDGLPEKDFTPPPAPPERRTYWRHNQSGERGFRVEDKDADLIQLDRPMETIQRPFHAGEWSVESEDRPIRRAALAQVAQAADAQLCKALGLHEHGKTEWLSLSDEQRILWMNDGPQVFFTELFQKSCV